MLKWITRETDFAKWGVNDVLSKSINTEAMYPHTHTHTCVYIYIYICIYIIRYIYLIHGIQFISFS